MDKVTFWKTFILNRELHISGTLIFNGLKAFDDLSYSNYNYDPDYIFEFLYNVSIGIERLGKIVLILQNEDLATEDKIIKYVKGLKDNVGHDHIKLINKIAEKTEVNLGSIHYEFLTLIKNFYSFRYNNYSIGYLDKTNLHGKENIELTEFLNKNLGLEIDITKDESFSTGENTDHVKIFIGETVGKIALELFKLVETYAHHNNVYTYEIKLQSKAGKVFVRKEFNFIKDKLIRKELLSFIMTRDSGDVYLDILKELDPLDLDDYHTKDFAKEFVSGKVLFEQDFIDQVEFQHEEMEEDDLEERKKALSILDEI